MSGSFCSDQLIQIEMHPFISSKPLSPSTSNLSIIVGQPRARRSKRSKTFFGRPAFWRKEVNAVIHNGFRQRDEQVHRRVTKNEPIVYRGNVVRVQVPRYCYTISDNFGDELGKDQKKIGSSLESDDFAVRSADDFERPEAFHSSTFRYHSDPNILESYSFDENLSDSSIQR